MFALVAVTGAVAWRSWQEFGGLGPKRMKPASETTGPQAFGSYDNPHTLLDQADLVFIDPVGTGFSRAVKTDQANKFFSLKGDIDSVGEFIRLYLTRYGRWGSPKYLIGESYGTTRASGLSLHLQDKHDIFLNGVMLVSLAVDPHPGFVASDVELLRDGPSYTAETLRTLHAEGHPASPRESLQPGRERARSSSSAWEPWEAR